MADLAGLSDAQVLLLAARYISDVSVESLQILAAERRDVLTDNRIYRLLLSLYPQDETARAALLSLLSHIDTNFTNVSSLDTGASIDTSTVVKLSPDLAVREARRLLLPELKNEERDSDTDPLSSFIISWCRHLESTDASLQDLVPLADEFAPTHTPLREWAGRYLLPVIRLQYYFYLDDDRVPTISELENLSITETIKALLRCAENLSSRANIARDLEEVVLPWIQGGRLVDREAAWQALNTWIFSTSQKDFDLASKALLEWSPPLEYPTVVSQYAKTGLAILYTAQPNSEPSLQTCRNILRQMANLMDLKVPDTSSATELANEAARLTSVTETDLLSKSLLAENNMLTQVSNSSISFLAGLLKTAEILLIYRISANTSEIALVCINGFEERQEQEVRHILQQIPKLTSTLPAWEVVRQHLLWLHLWSSNAPAGSNVDAPTFLRKVPFQQIDEKLLDCILAQGSYGAAKSIFLDVEPRPLPTSTIEGRVVAATLFAYDNASNGNRTRGGVKRAFELLEAFRPKFPESERLNEIDHLIKATHSLSFYSLTLQHGVPFQPVNIRAQRDPLALIGKVLEQETRAYTKLDDLLGIGRNLVLAHLQKESDNAEEDDNDANDRIYDAQHTITYLAIKSALAAHDFDTAYSYITTRLSLSPSSGPPAKHKDDASWKAAYAAGRYKPNTTPKSLHERIGSLSKRMDLLSLALTLAPTADPLSEILGQWRRCEEEMDSLRGQALDEERAFEMRSDDIVPGGFGFEDRERDANETRQALAKRSVAGGSATYEEQAPMSLFDVASGAARALSRSTQRLRGGSLKDLKIRDSHPVDPRAGAVSPDDSDASRVRKRDMVGSMVTSGLVSGMGWVLGAQPAEKKVDELN